MHIRVDYLSRNPRPAASLLSSLPSHAPSPPSTLASPLSPFQWPRRRHFLLSNTSNGVLCRHSSSTHTHRGGVAVCVAHVRGLRVTHPSPSYPSASHPSPSHPSPSHPSPSHPSPSHTSPSHTRPLIRVPIRVALLNLDTRGSGPAGPRSARRRACWFTTREALPTVGYAGSAGCAGGAIAPAPAAPFAPSVARV